MNGNELKLLNKLQKKLDSAVKRKLVKTAHFTTYSSIVLDCNEEGREFHFTIDFLQVSYTYENSRLTHPKYFQVLLTVTNIELLINGIDKIFKKG